MLRPATPLTVVLFCAFVLLLISSLSSPVIRKVPLARWEQYNFGVLGYCADDGRCSDSKVGYSTDNLFGEMGVTPDFNLPISARHSLSSLLIVHPVAAFMTLIMLALAAASHFHAPSHSPRYLLALLILTLPTLLITLLAFLVDILLFIPHLAWGGWICLAATILIVISGICLCAMRRTLVSRKARRKRIQENAEMSGENFYSRQRDQEAKLTVATPVSESKAPLVNGAPGADILPPHATYAEFRSDQLRQQAHEPTLPINDDNGNYDSTFSGPTLNNSTPAATSQQSSIPQSQLPDGNYQPLSYGQGRGGAVYRGRGASRPYPRGGPRGGGVYRGHPGMQGRGGYGLDSRGAYRGRGGPMIPSGGAGGMMARRPPPGYPPRQSEPYATQYTQDSNGYAQPTSSTDYARHAPTRGFQQAYGVLADTSRGGGGIIYENRRSSDGTDGLARAETPPDMSPIIQEADTNVGGGYTGNLNQRRGTSQDGRPTGPPSTEQYIPVRNEWQQSRASQDNRPRGTSVASQSSSHYYEDVPNQFATQDIATLLHPNQTVRLDPTPKPQGHPLPPADQFEEVPPGARSPATSEQSAWTSVSQRPVNPDWMPGHGGEFNQFAPAKRPNQAQARRDMLLSNNPDFSVPILGPNRAPGRGRGGPSGGVGTTVAPSSMDMGGDGRYPEPNIMTTREI